MARFTVAAILSLAAQAFASAVPAVQGTEGTTNLPGVTLVGAANPTYAYQAHAASSAVVTEAAKVKRMDTPPEYLTFTIINSHGAAISTSHVRKCPLEAILCTMTGVGMTDTRSYYR